jgi:hypothetical protein
MNIYRKIFPPIAIFICFYLSGCTSKIAQNSVPVPGSAEWVSAASQSSQLGSPTRLNNFSIQLPKSFYDLNAVQQAGIYRREYGGFAHNQTVTSFINIEIYPETQLARQEDFATAVKHWEKRITAQYQPKLTNYIQAPVEIGEVNGMPAARIYVRGVSKYYDGTLDNLHVIEYRFRSNGVDAFVTASDIEPYSKDTLPILEASLLTMQPSK